MFRWDDGELIRLVTGITPTMHDGFPLNGAPCHQSFADAYQNLAAARVTLSPEAYEFVYLSALLAQAHAGNPQFQLTYNLDRLWEKSPLNEPALLEALKTSFAGGAFDHEERLKETYATLAEICEAQGVTLDYATCKQLLTWMYRNAASSDGITPDAPGAPVLAAFREAMRARHPDTWEQDICGIGFSLLKMFESIEFRFEPDDFIRFDHRFFRAFSIQGMVTYYNHLGQLSGSPITASLASEQNADRIFAELSAFETTAGQHLTLENMGNIQSYHTLIASMSLITEPHYMVDSAGSFYIALSLLTHSAQQMHLPVEEQSHPAPFYPHVHLDEEQTYAPIRERQGGTILNFNYTSMRSEGQVSPVLNNQTQGMGTGLLRYIPRDGSQKWHYGLALSTAPDASPNWRDAMLFLAEHRLPAVLQFLSGSPWQFTQDGYVETTLSDATEAQDIARRLQWHPVPLNVTQEDGVLRIALADLSLPLLEEAAREKRQAPARKVAASVPEEIPPAEARTAVPPPKRPRVTTSYNVLKWTDLLVNSIDITTMPAVHQQDGTLVSHHYTEFSLLDVARFAAPDLPEEKLISKLEEWGFGIEHMLGVRIIVMAGEGGERKQTYIMGPRPEQHVMISGGHFQFTPEHVEGDYRWKFHFSVDSKDIGVAWDELTRIAARHGVQMKAVKNPFAYMHGGDDFSGKMFTVYAEDLNKPWGDIIQEMEDALARAGVQPGLKVETDRQVPGSNYCYYRFERPEEKDVGNFDRTLLLEAGNSGAQYKPQDVEDPFLDLTVEALRQFPPIEDTYGISLERFSNLSRAEYRLLFLINALRQVEGFVESSFRVEGSAGNELLTFEIESSLNFLMFNISYINLLPNGATVSCVETLPEMTDDARLPMVIDIENLVGREFAFQEMIHSLRDKGVGQSA
ncbi:MAG: hypothetical protein J0L97_06025 [Alphaproteobacteria bacterium]|nr:hypothetical protein [Alphaproteobacteria bacterium]